jgi:hypothetical protein
MPLPFFTIEKNKSMKIDKKGFYWILSEYRKAARQLNLELHGGPTWTNGYNKFKADDYYQWMHYMFRMNKILDGRKSFRAEGVGIMTNAVKASVLYITPRPPVPDPVEVEEEESLLQSIQQLSLSPPDDDDDIIDVVDDIGYVDIVDEESVIVGDDENGSIGNESNVSIIHIHDGTVHPAIPLISFPFHDLI